MAISPPSDIVLDVARAADPVKHREAVERLQRLREAAGAARASPPAKAETAAADAEPQRASAAPLPKPAHRAAARHDRLDPYAQFEAFVLQGFVEAMLPKGADSVFGKGFAGDVWKSLLAEKLAAEIARGGGVGIAQRVAAAGSLAPRPAPALRAEASAALAGLPSTAPAAAAPAAAEPDAGLAALSSLINDGS